MIADQDQGLVEPIYDLRDSEAYFAAGCVRSPVRAIAKINATSRLRLCSSNLLGSAKLSASKSRDHDIAMIGFQRSTDRLDETDEVAKSVFVDRRF